MAHHPLGIGAEQIIGEFRTVGRHYDQIGVDFARGAQDLAIDRAVADDVLHLHTRGDVLIAEGLQLGAGFLDNFLLVSGWEDMP